MTKSFPLDRAAAQRLAWLLAQSVMPEEQKAAWLNLLPILSVDQVQRLMQVLEQEQASYQTVSADLFADLDTLASEMQSSLDRLQAKERQAIERYVQQLLHGKS
jgi:hypothetical protein